MGKQDGFVPSVMGGGLWITETWEEQYSSWSNDWKNYH
jgi:hypothetical protein